jgi:hypothetical protein
MPLPNLKIHIVMRRGYLHSPWKQRSSSYICLAHTVSSNHIWNIYM